MDVLRQENYGQAAISPNGAHVLFQHCPRYDRLTDFGIYRLPDVPWGRIMSYLPESGRTEPLELQEGAEYRLARFSPNSRYVTIFRLQAGRVACVAYDFVDRKVVEIAESPDVLTFDRSSLVWISNEEFLFTSPPNGDLPGILYLRSAAKQRTEAWAQTWAGKTPSFVEMRSSPAQTTGPEPRESRLIRANVRTGESVILARGTFRKMQTSRDGKYVSAEQTFEEPARPPMGIPFQTWFGQRGSTARRVKISLTTGVITTLDSGVDSASSDWTPASADDLSYFDRSTKELPGIVKPSASCLVLATNSKSRSMVCKEPSASGLRLWYLRAGQPDVLLGEANRYLGGLKRAQRKIFFTRLDDGTELRSVMFLPADFSADRKWPVVFYIYPHIVSTDERQGLDRWDGSIDQYSPELWAAKGYIIYYAANDNRRNRTSEGPLTGFPNTLSQQIDALVSAGIADPNRLALYGFSQGGYTALWLAAQMPRFKAVISGNSWSDNTSYYLASGRFAFFHLRQSFGSLLDSFVRFENPTGPFAFERTLWDNPADYQKASPIVQADKITAAVFLSHTDMDNQFPDSQYDEMYTALFRLHKEVLYVKYLGEPHGLYSPANILDYWCRTYSWLDTWCDVSRSTDGSLIWEGDQIKSRHGKPAWSPKDFLKYENDSGSESPGGHTGKP